MQTQDTTTEYMDEDTEAEVAHTHEVSPDDKYGYPTQMREVVDWIQEDTAEGDQYVGDEQEVKSNAWGIVDRLCHDWGETVNWFVEVVVSEIKKVFEWRLMWYDAHAFYAVKHAFKENNQVSYDTGQKEVTIRGELSGIVT